MKKSITNLLILLSLIIFSCESPTETKDCADVAGGTAVKDNCDDCVGGTTNLTACTQDCAGVWGGDATTTECDACTSGVFDCANTCDGTSVEDNCGTCDNDPSNDCSPLTQSNLYYIIYEDNSFISTWTQNNDAGFQSYTLYESQSEDMSDQTAIFNTNIKTDTSYTISGISEGEIRYYQIIIEDSFGQKTQSTIKRGSAFLKFMRTYGADEKINKGYAIAQTSENDYVISGIHVTNNQLLLLKINIDGDTLWSTIHETSTKGLSVIENDENDIVVTGYGGWGPSLTLGKYSGTDGSEIWKESYSYSRANRGNDVKQTLDGGYIMTSSHYGGANQYGIELHMIAIKTNHNGEMIWEQYRENYDSENDDMELDGRYVQQTIDGGYVVCGNKWLWKLGEDGEIEWVNENISGVFVEQTPDGGFLVVDREKITKADSGGNEAWSNAIPYELSNDGNNADIIGVDRTQDGGIVVFGSTLEGWEMILIKFDNYGLEQWMRTYNYTEDLYASKEWGHSVKQTPDGGFLLLGQTISGSDKKMAITMTHRYDQDKTTLINELSSGKYGKIDYLIHPP